MEIEVGDFAGPKGDCLAAEGVGDVGCFHCVGTGRQAAHDIKTIGESHGADVGSADVDVGVGHGLARFIVENTALDGNRIVYGAVTLDGSIDLKEGFLSGGGKSR